MKENRTVLPKIKHKLASVHKDIHNRNRIYGPVWTNMIHDKTHLQEKNNLSMNDDFSIEKRSSIEKLKISNIRNASTSSISQPKMNIDKSLEFI